MCPRSDKVLKNEHRQQTNRTRRTDCVTACLDYWDWAVRYPVERRVHSPVTTACGWAAFTGDTLYLPAEAKTL